MSSRPCNRCVLEAMRREAASHGELLETEPSTRNPELKLGGVDVYVRRPDQEPDRRSPDAGNQQWRGWLMAVPDTCAC